jgi:formylmethanofuran dehydrogenase subunit B
VKQVTGDPIESAADRRTCAVCPLLCDDIAIAGTEVAGACSHGRDAIVADADATHPEAMENGAAVSRERAIQAAADRLASARRVLVTGLANGTLEAIGVACRIAESLGAAVDAGLPESSHAAGPTIARAGEVTAAWEELRDRADLVLFWCCDPAVTHPRFLERFVAAPLPDGRPRLSIAVGRAAVFPESSTHRHLPLAGRLAAEAARCLHLRLSGRHAPAFAPPDPLACAQGLYRSRRVSHQSPRREPGDPGHAPEPLAEPPAEPLAAVSAALLEAIRSATCVAIVTSDADDEVGLEAWSIVHLVRAIAHEKPAFQVPLGAGLAGGGANVAGAAAACTWKYGAAGAIDRADRMGGRFLPGESAALRLIDRGEVDAVLVLGQLNATLERAVAGRGPALSLVRISAEPQPDAPVAGRSVRLRCASGIATTGTMLREDGRRVELRPCRESAAPQMADLLADLAAAVRRSLAASSAGDRA